ncbi:hypothetical protein APSETT444_010386 [Aspergillus pseudonomiae]
MLKLDQAHLNTKQIMDLMAVKQENGEMPLYMHTVKRILREMRIEQQGTKGPFDYQAFKSKIIYGGLARRQLGPLKQRLETLESFMVDKQGDPWRRKSPLMGKYMNTFPKAHAFTETLLSVVRPPRHLAARVVISTQEPTVSTDLLSLCSVTFVHRFTSPEWLRTLQKHLAAAAANPFTSPAKPGNTTHDTGESSADQNLSSLFDNVVQLRIGEALLFAPSAIVKASIGQDGRLEFHPLGSEFFPMKI